MLIVADDFQLALNSAQKLRNIRKGTSLEIEENNLGTDFNLFNTNSENERLQLLSTDKIIAPVLQKKSINITKATSVIGNSRGYESE